MTDHGSPTTGRVALVTGASRGIGAAVAERLAADGATVVLAARDAEALAAAARRITEAGGTAVPHPLDVTDEDAVRRCVRAAVDAHGGLHLLVTAANAARGRPAPIGRTPVTDLDAGWAVAVRGTWSCLHHGLPAIAAAGGGSAVVIASTAGLRPVAGTAAYAVTEAALIGLVRTAALDHAADGVRVNAVAPGPVRTHLLERAGADAIRRRSGCRSAGSAPRPRSQRRWPGSVTTRPPVSSPAACSPWTVGCSPATRRSADDRAVASAGWESHSPRAATSR